MAAGHRCQSWSGTYRAPPLFSEVPGSTNRQADLNEAAGVSAYQRHPREFVLMAPVVLVQASHKAILSQLSDMTTIRQSGPRFKTPWEILRESSPPAGPCLRAVKS